MRILFASEATGFSGGANQICWTAPRLIARGHQIAAACNAEADLGSRLKAAGVPVFDFRPRQDYDLFAARELARIAQEWDADLIHAHHPRAHAMAALSTLFGFARPLLVTRRVIYPVGRNPFSRIKYTSARITQYVAVCDAASEELQKAGVERGRIAVIPSGVDMSRWEVSRQARAAVRGRRPFVITMVGHYSPIKGHEVLLEAAARITRRRKDVVFRIAGRDTPSLQERARQAGLNGELELMGERRDVPELLADTSLYVMPSLQEGIGTALIEAQAGLVPVVASRVGGLPQVIDNGRTGILVEPGDAEALAKAIVRQLDDPEGAERMARAGYERVRGQFAIEAVLDRLETIYRSLTA